MFGFLLRKKQDEVRSLFANLMNRNAIRHVCEEHRENPRGEFCEVAWLIPLETEERQPLFAAGVPVVTRDISQEGLAVVYSHPLDEEDVVIALPGEIAMRYVICRREHSTPMGHGFHLIGLHPVQVLDLTPDEETGFFERQKQFEKSVLVSASV